MLAVAALSFVSCSSDESYDVYGNPDNLVYLDLRGPKTYESKLLSTPVGIFGMAGAFIPVHAQHATSGMASVEVVDSLVARYNRENKTEYPAFPAEALKALEITPAHFADNQKDTIQVNVPEDKFALFTEPTYVLPLVLSDVQGGVATEIEDYKIAYVLVNVSSTEDFISITGDKTVNCGIVKTPVGVFGGVSASFGASIKAAVATDWNNTLEVDNSLIAAYNEKNGTEYSALPENVLSSLQITPNVIAKGQTSSTADIKVSLPDDIAQALDKSYIIPLRLKTTYGDKTYQEDNDVAYILIDISTSLVNKGAARSAIPGEEIPVANMGTWTINPGSIGDFADNNSESGSDIDSNTPFVIDMQAVKNVGGIGLQGMYANYYLSYYGINSCKLELSEDGNEWTNAGTASYDEMSSDSNGYQYFVLYGAVPARYIRLTLESRSSWWGGLAELRIFAQNN
jgi:hypothetical protein